MTRRTPVGLAASALRRVPWADNAVQSRLLAADLRRLDRVLSGTAMAGRYWVFGGVLLGWARERRLLRHDRDADLVMSAEDEERFLASAPKVVAAGFRPMYRFVNNDGQVTEYSFIRHAMKFEFFLYRPSPERPGFWRYYVYDRRPDGGTQLANDMPAQSLSTFRFLGRTWRKPADHEAFLDLAYGNWHTPDPDWSYYEEGTIVSRQPWWQEDITWSGH